MTAVGAVTTMEGDKERRETDHAHLYLHGRRELSYDARASVHRPRRSRTRRGPVHGSEDHIHVRVGPRWPCLLFLPVAFPGPKTKGVIMIRAQRDISST